MWMTSAATVAGVGLQQMNSKLTWLHFTLGMWVKYYTVACNECNLVNGKIIDDIMLKITREAYKLSF